MPITIEKAHDDKIKSIVYIPNTSYIATASLDKK